MRGARARCGLHGMNIVGLLSSRPILADMNRKPQQPPPTSWTIYKLAAGQPPDSPFRVGLLPLSSVTRQGQPLGTGIASCHSVRAAGSKQQWPLTCGRSGTRMGMDEIARLAIHRHAQNPQRAYGTDPSLRGGQEMAGRSVDDLERRLMSQSLQLQCNAITVKTKVCGFKNSPIPGRLMRPCHSLASDGDSQ